ncbi:MAG: hypothetical protein P4L87_21995 [Formivibrio sp.]|nr:hypothetical protein [Formivibrio sp.]
MKKKISKPESLSSLEDFPFVLPGHDENRCRKKYVSIDPAPAAPLVGREWLEREALFKQLPNEKSVVKNSAVAAKAINSLALLACAGDGKALWEFAKIVSDAADMLNQIAETKPEAVKPFARKIVNWPMFRSTQPHLCDDDALLEKIELGKNTGIALDNSKKWKPNRFSLAASSLIQYLERRRLQSQEFLPPFNKDTHDQWWEKGKVILLARYPKLEEVAELDALITAKTKRRFPSQRRAAILDQIKVSFLNLAKDPHKKAKIHECDCGNPATQKINGEWICERCQKETTR